MRKIKGLQGGAKARQSLAYLCILCKQTPNEFSDFCILIFAF
jgi:hypothetical protein